MPPDPAMVASRYAAILWAKVIASASALQRKIVILAGVGLVAISALSLMTLPCVAATATTTFPVTATIQATCGLTATPMTFGVYTGAVLTSTATVTITCTNTTPYNVGLSVGLGTGATVTTRSMTFSGSSLNYVLTSNAGHTTNWGFTIGTDTVVGTGNGAAQVLTIYGQIAAGQFLTPGAYTDTITATVSY